MIMSPNLISAKSLIKKKSCFGVKDRIMDVMSHSIKFGGPILILLTLRRASQHCIRGKLEDKEEFTLQNVLAYKKITRLIKKMGLIAWNGLSLIRVLLLNEEYLENTRYF